MEKAIRDAIITAIKKEEKIVSYNNVKATEKKQPESDYYRESEVEIANNLEAVYNYSDEKIVINFQPK